LRWLIVRAGNRVEVRVVRADRRAARVVRVEASREAAGREAVAVGRRVDRVVAREDQVVAREGLAGARVIGRWSAVRPRRSCSL
jgi:hypothetical protein